MSVHDGKSVADRVRYFSGEDLADGNHDNDSRGNTGSAATDTAVSRKPSTKVGKRTSKRGKGGKETANDDKSRPEVIVDSQDGKCDDDEYPCDNCKAVGMSEHLIQCECCERWLCCVCQKITNAMAKAILRWEQLHWFCLDCEDAAIKAAKAPSKNKLITDVAVETASLIITTVQSELSKGSLKMTTSYAQVVKDMSTIACPKPKSDGTTPVPATDPDSPVKPQQVVEHIDEYLDREKRINNLIFHNLPELEATAPSPAERTQHDQGKICEILKDEFHLTGVAMKKCI